MVFSDLLFIYIFLAATLLLYFLARTITQRNCILIIASVFFYAWGEPFYVFLLILSSLINYVAGLLIDRYRKYGKLITGLTLLYDFGMLAVYKYAGFFVENINSLFGISIPVPDIVMPIGISFFTFQIVSYVIDCYWEKVKVQKNFFWLLMYISLFPQLIAGPIVRYETIEKEISNRRTTVADFSDGLTRFIVGLAKKAVIANSLSIVVDNLFLKRDGAFHVEESSIAGVWVGVIAFALYVYFDFSGYSDMAIGMGRIFGFHFDENFNYPFVSSSITEFWQRWHISLGTFFRDYLLYVPIFGKRRKYASLFLVWFCTGFWHGASWNYIIWGLYFGIFIFIETLLGKKRMKRIPSPIAHVYSLIVIIIGFGIFRFEDLSQLGYFFKGLVGANGNAFLTDTSETAILQNMFLIAFAAVISMPILPAVKKFFSSRTSLAVVGSSLTVFTNVGLLILSSIMLIDATNNPFMYFRF
ncbi:MAG: membrane-bound O-acyltransferase family protein [Clostridiales bacterium]|nr:MAG: membrane-bound O-acyltransferase family protein [Clostridiales bacterium]